MNNYELSSKWSIIIYWFFVLYNCFLRNKNTSDSKYLMWINKKNKKGQQTYIFHLCYHSLISITETLLLEYLCWCALERYIGNNYCKIYHKYMITYIYINIHWHIHRTNQLEDFIIHLEGNIPLNVLYHMSWISLILCILW